MQQYDICKLKHGDIVLILQHKAFSGFKTRIAAPLVPRSRGKLATSLNPIFRHANRDWVLAPQLMGPVPIAAIAETIGSLANEDYAIKRAVDQLFLGL